MVLLACPGVLIIYAMFIDAMIYQFRREDYILSMFICSSFVVNSKLFWVVDNMHLIEKELGNVKAAPLRIVRPQTSP